MLQETNDIIRIWPDIKSIFSVAHSKAEYDRQVSFLDSLLDEDEGHPLASLVETVGSLVETYETAHLSEHEGAPADILNCLMQEHGIRHGDLLDVYFRVEASVTRCLPHRSVRAELPHTVPQLQLFLPS